MAPARASVAWLAAWAAAPALATFAFPASEPPAAGTQAAAADAPDRRAAALLEFRRLHAKLRQDELTGAEWRALEQATDALAAEGRAEAAALVAPWRLLDATGRAQRRGLLASLWTRYETSAEDPDAQALLQAELAAALDADPERGLRAELLHLRCAAHLRAALDSAAPAGRAAASAQRAVEDGRLAAEDYRAAGWTTLRRQLMPLVAEAWQLLGEREAALDAWSAALPLEGASALDSEPDAARRALAADSAAHAWSAMVELHLQSGRVAEAQDLLWETTAPEGGWLAALERHEASEREAANAWWWTLSDSLWRLRSAEAWIALSQDRCEDALEALQGLEPWFAELQEAAAAAARATTGGAQATDAWECVQRLRREHHVLLGGALQRCGSFELAAAHYAQADADVARLGRAELALAAGTPAVALELASAGFAAEAAGPHARAHAMALRGRALLGLGRPAQARDELEGALRASLRAAGGEHGVPGELVGVETAVQLARAQLALGDALGAAVALCEWQGRDLRPADAAPLRPADLTAWAARSELGLLVCGAGSDSFVAVHVDRGGKARAVETLDLPRQQLARAVERVVRAARDGDEARARELGAQLALRLRLAGPAGGAAQEDALLGRLPTATAADLGRLLVVAPGVLEDLPFDLLPPFGAGTGPRRVAQVLPGLPAARPRGAPDARGAQWAELDWSLLGDPRDAQGRAFYPRAGAELEVLSALLDTRGEAVARATLAAALASGRALHLATHLEQGPAGPALQLDGVQLGREELRTLLRPLPIAVLAACGSARGASDEGAARRSIAREFLRSGTPVVVATLWPVGDGAARLWSERFHAALREGLAPSRAALAAREELRGAGFSSADWAAFRVLGQD